MAQLRSAQLGSVQPRDLQLSGSHWRCAIAAAVDDALWRREWNRIVRWLGSARGLLLSALALFFLAYVLAPMLIVDFTDWDTLRALRRTPGWAFFTVTLALQLFAGILAAVRSGQVLSREYHGRLLEQFLIAFAEAPRVAWTLHAAGFVQALLFSGVVLPILALYALGQPSISPRLFLATLLLTTAFAFLTAALGVLYFFVIHKLVAWPTRRRVAFNALAASALWAALEGACYFQGLTGDSTDVVARALFAWALIWLWNATFCGWHALSRAVGMQRWLTALVTLAGTTSVLLCIALAPTEIFVAGRLKSLPLFLLPFPFVVGAAMPERWDDIAIYLFGDPTSVLALMPALALFYMAVGMAAMESVTAGYARLWRNPESLYRRGNADEDAVAQTAEVYWRGLRNAVWTLEVRGRLRNRDTATFMTFAAAVTALGGFFPLFSGLEVLNDPLRLAEVARAMFDLLVLTEVALVTFLVPGFTSEAIGLEQEHQTLDLMVATALAPSEILLGKLLGAVSTMMLLVSPSLPLFAFCCVFHGATVNQVLSAYAVMVLAAVMWGALGVTVSATTRELIVAKYLTYGAVIVTAVIPGSPVSLALYLANPNRMVMGFSFGDVLGFSVLWLTFGVILLAAQWAAACQRLGPMYGSER